jgi:hypothetical protein
MRQVCGPSHERLLDCNHDDYFHTNPSRSSYLGSRWNVARSSFLTAEHIEVGRDTTKPTVQPARQAIVSPSTMTLGGSPQYASIRMRITWRATDDSSGIAAYHAYRTVDGGAWQHVSSGEQTGIDTYHQGGHTYQYTVLAVDGSGNQSDWTSGAPFTITVIDGPDSRISYSGSWSDRGLTSGHIGSSTRVTTANGSRAGLSFYGSEIAWVATAADRTSTAGYLDAFVDGNRLGNFSTYAPNGPRGARVMGSVPWSQAGNHTAAIQKTGGYQVDVDAFVVIS